MPLAYTRISTGKVISSTQLKKWRNPTIYRLFISAQYTCTNALNLIQPKLLGLILTYLFLNITVSWDVTPYSLVDVTQHSEATYRWQIPALLSIYQTTSPQIQKNISLIILWQPQISYAYLQLTLPF
jgi:hypothetical protein